MSEKSNKAARFRRINSAKASAAWRNQPANPVQWAVLRRIGRESGARFAESISSGEASEIIVARFAANPSAERASRRARRRRAEESRGRARSLRPS